jgi:hypothetical protein
MRVTVPQKSAMRHRSGCQCQDSAQDKWSSQPLPSPVFSSLQADKARPSPTPPPKSRSVPFSSLPQVKTLNLPRGSLARSLGGSAMAPPALGSQVRTATPRARCRAPIFSACTLLTSRSLPFRAGGRRSLGSRRLGVSCQGRGAQGAWRTHTRAWPPSFGESRGSVCIVVTVEHYSPGRVSPPPPIFLMKSSDTPMVSEAKCLPFMVLFRC